MQPNDIATSLLRIDSSVSTQTRPYTFTVSANVSLPQVNAYPDMFVLLKSIKQWIVLFSLFFGSLKAADAICSSSFFTLYI